jgi:hypothetical protein
MKRKRLRAPGKIESRHSARLRLTTLKSFGLFGEANASSDPRIRPRRTPATKLDQT